MNYYINLISKSIEYIEDNIEKELSLELISREFNLSQYHFDRLFSIIVKRSYKQYVLGRKLTKAADMLSNTNKLIIDIAYEMGFNYPEVFSRAFKKQFGISPNTYRKQKNSIQRIDKVLIIPRNLINYKGKVILKPKCIQIERAAFLGIEEEIDVYSKGFEKKLYNVAKGFLSKTNRCRYLNQDSFFNMIVCNGEGTSTYKNFFCKKINDEFITRYRQYISSDINLKEKIIDSSLYACFTYRGKMSEIRNIIEDDIFRWIAVKEIKLNSIGIGLITVYDDDYYKEGIIKILVPICNDKV